MTFLVDRHLAFLKSGHLFTLSCAAEVTELLLGDIQQLVQDRVIGYPGYPLLPSDLKFPK